MKRIPDVLLNEVSSAERRVFDLLEDVDLGRGWCAYHSLNCSEHAYKQWSEIDFLLVGPEGLYVLEVKGGGVSLQDGLWSFQDRFHRVHMSNEGPFQQAKSARFALERLLEQRFDLRSYPVRPRFGFGVVFPDCPWVVETPEMPRAVVADKTQCESADRLGAALRTIVGYWSSKVTQRAPLEKPALEHLRKAIRPNVDVFPPFSVQLGKTVRELHSLTEEQYVLLDVMEANEQVVVSGGAGTGKTFLLLQGARREVARGNSVLVVTESDILAAQLRKLEPDQQVFIRSMRKLKQKDLGRFSVLFVDEGQDLVNEDALGLLDRNVYGGLEKGRWRWFMDENNQARIVGQFDEEVLELLRAGLGGVPPVRLPLSRNVRNTKPIVDAVEKWTRTMLGRAQASGHGGPPRVILVYGGEDPVTKLEERLVELASDDVPLEEIGIIVAAGMKDSFHERLSRRWRRKLVRLDPATVRAELTGKVLVGTAAEFKGLERPVQIVVGLAPGLSAQSVADFYVATTRANYDLTIITDHAAWNEATGSEEMKWSIDGSC